MVSLIGFCLFVCVCLDVVMEELCKELHRSTELYVTHQHTLTLDIVRLTIINSLSAEKSTDNHLSEVVGAKMERTGKRKRNAPASPPPDEPPFEEGAAVRAVFTGSAILVEEYESVALLRKAVWYGTGRYDRFSVGKKIPYRLPVPETEALFARIASLKAQVRSIHAQLRQVRASQPSQEGGEEEGGEERREERREGRRGEERNMRNGKSANTASDHKRERERERGRGRERRVSLGQVG